MKQIIVFGANGRVGRLVVNRLVAQGYHVTAFVHSASGLAQDNTVQVIEGDVRDHAAVMEAIQGADAVISTLGSWGTSTKDILSSGMAHILPAMSEHGIKRIISLTGSEARASGDRLSPIHRLAHFGVTLAAGKILVDGEVHIKQLEASGLEWTVVRSPIMNSKGSSDYVLSNERPFPWATINRQAVADALVDQLTEVRFVGMAPYISR